jgi:hypothetical protein
MTLCDICEKINIQQLISRSPSWPGQPHQPTFNALTVSAINCDLCALIHSEIVPQKDSPFASCFQNVEEHSNHVSSAISFAALRGGDVAGTLINSLEFRTGDGQNWMHSARFHVCVKNGTLQTVFYVQTMEFVIEIVQEISLHTTSLGSMCRKTRDLMCLWKE